MPVLQDQDRAAVQQRFDAELRRDVNLTLYTQADIGLYIPGRECQTCGQAQELVEEVCALSPKIHLKTVDFYKDTGGAADLGISRIPAIVFGSQKNGRARYFGLPSGYEFALFIESIIGAAERRSPLKLETRRQLRHLKEDVHIRVFVTPN